MGVAGRRMPKRRSTCAVCGKPIKHPKLAYCSKECQVEAGRQRINHETKELRLKEMHERSVPSLDGEVWRPVEGFECEYEVSNLGRVRTLNFFRVTKEGKQYPVKSRLLKQYEHNGYLHVNLPKNGRYKRFRVHRLVAAAFLPNTYNKPAVNHIDGNKQNNNVDNLEWCTPSENTRHALANGLIHPDSTAGIEARRKPVIRDDGVMFKSMTDMAKDIERTTGTACGYIRDGRVAPNGHTYRYMTVEEIRDMKIGD